MITTIHWADADDSGSVQIELSLRPGDAHANEHDYPEIPRAMDCSD
jgi:hypothetical protein